MKNRQIKQERGLGVRLIPWVCIIMLLRSIFVVVYEGGCFIEKLSNV